MQLLPRLRNIALIAASLLVLSSLASRAAANTVPGPWSESFSTRPWSGYDRLSQDTLRAIARGADGLLKSGQNSTCVRYVAFEILLHDSCQVFQTDSPAAIREIACEHWHGIDGLITEVIRSRNNGLQLSERSRRLCPDMPALFISGYSARVLNDKDWLPANDNRLAKPCDSKTLSERIAPLVPILRS